MRVISGFLLVSMMLAGFCWPASALAVRLVSVVMAKSVSKDLEPIEVTDSFSPGDKGFHAVVVLADCSSSDTAKGVWVAVDAAKEPDTAIDSTPVIKLKKGQSRLHFSLTNDKPGYRWPTGHYKLEIYLNNVYVMSVPFTVTSSSAGGMGKTTASNGRGLEGSWVCTISNGGMMLGNGLVRFQADNTVVVGEKTYAYRVSGASLILSDEGGLSLPIPPAGKPAQYAVCGWHNVSMRTKHRRKSGGSHPGRHGPGHGIVGSGRSIRRQRMAAQRFVLLLGRVYIDGVGRQQYIRTYGMDTV